MKNRYTFQVCILWLILATPLFGQDAGNCFLRDYEVQYATIPPYADVEKTAAAATVTVTINTADTLGKVSKYVLGNAVAVWVAQNVNNPVLMNYLRMLSPTLIRYPGGSWSDIFFWSGNPGDLPDSIYDGTTYNSTTGAAQKTWLYPQYGTSCNPTVDSYYDLRDQLGTQGLITINYGYARYGLSAKPVEQAAHLAANWVRYDDGRTKFWEIGNESAGTWEAGWLIDTTKNQDGQPAIITGELYGKHFKVFADSMRAAAAELDETIFIGGQILHYDGTGSWNIADRKWNEGFFQEVGDAADFYVMHNYFGTSASTLKNQVDIARTTINQNITFIRQDIANKQASLKPIALTEWNCGGPDVAKTSIANGMQAVVLFCEMMKNNFGMSARWLIANWESDGMFYYGNDGTIPRWNPRPDFYFIYYLQQFVGDHVVSTSSGNKDVLAYATTFSSGEVGVVVVNKGKTEQQVSLKPLNYGCGERYYVYSLTGGSDNVEFSQMVYVNDNGPTGAAWGPLDGLADIPARAYPVGDEIKFTSPARSLQYILLEPGTNFVSVRNDGSTENGLTVPKQFMVYPSPTRGSFQIDLPRSGFTQVDIVDLMGRTIYSKVINPTQTVVQLQPNLASGSYFVRLHNRWDVKVTKLIICK